MCSAGDNRTFEFICIISMIMGLMSNFGFDMRGVFVVDKTVYKIVDICFKSLH